MSDAAARYLLDTNILSDLIRNPNGRAAGRLARAGEHLVCTSVVVACELRFGAHKKGARVLLERVEALLGRLPVLALEPGVDRSYARIRADLERRGKLIGGNDLLIAAHAMSVGSVLVTENVREFRRVRELRLENWLAARG